MSGEINARAANTNLRMAKQARDDEFYTELSDVQAEVDNYKKHFRGKTVYCNCDNPEWSAFWEYFHRNFAGLGLKLLISTYYDPERPVYQMRYAGGRDGDVQAGDKILLQGNGDFRSPECLDILEQSDIVVTNSPFSLWREFVKTLIKHEKKFLVIGSKNAITYKDFFPLLKNNQVWIGCNMVKSFRRPDGSLQKFGNVGWFTNLDHDRRHEKLELVKSYYNDPESYVKYDNYDGIEVSRVADIPADYVPTGEYRAELMRRDGVPAAEIAAYMTAWAEQGREACNGIMGVPITFLDKFNPEQFEIIGQSREIGTPMADLFEPRTYQPGGLRFYLPEYCGADGDGKYKHRRLYDRIAIRWKLSDCFV